ncbi:MAG: hypothetical protein DRG78_04440 [Epsilonproteobacteria bacterium]|nr:MAG: hypothetical protein DRG78_04440 [Campylobacterota bacterium]
MPPEVLNNLNILHTGNPLSNVIGNRQPIGQYKLNDNINATSEIEVNGSDANLTNYTINKIIRAIIDFHLLQNGVEALEHFHKSIPFIDLEKEYRYLLKTRILEESEITYINEKLLELS